MDMKDVKSSQLAAVGYDPKTRKLHIRFNGRTNRKTGEEIPGSTYEYDDVPEHIYTGILAAHEDPDLSVGQHFGKHVRNGGFTYRKLG